MIQMLHSQIEDAWQQTTVDHIKTLLPEGREAMLLSTVAKNNKLGFSTKRNFKTESTELYDINYQYAIDCLTAGLVYRREFYEDKDDLKPKNSLMFTITFVPFTNVNTPIN